MSVRVEHGDCLEVMARLASEGLQVDSVITDPPYHLTSIVKRFGKNGSAPAKSGATGAYKRHSTGFMGKEWDGGDIAFNPETWALAYDLLKPGGHLLAFGLPKTFGRLQVAIEDAGFEIRDTICWLFGSGFPKSHDVSKGIDRAAGMERETVADNPNHRSASGIEYEGIYAGGNTGAAHITAPATDAARQWQGWGTALKPAAEFIVMARKPLIGTVAANVQEHGTGAINVDGCRVDTGSRPHVVSDRRLEHNTYGPGLGGSQHIGATTQGRWPANVAHDGSEEVQEAFAAFGEKNTGTFNGNRNTPKTRGIYGQFESANERGHAGDSGTAARFFYSAKATKADRLDSKHPTVKPVDLIAYLCRLVTPPGGLILDPFAGSGTTGMACIRESFECILIEREAEYVADINARLKHVDGSDTPLFEALEPESDQDSLFGAT